MKRVSRTNTEGTPVLNGHIEDIKPSMKTQDGVVRNVCEFYAFVDYQSKVGPEILLLSSSFLSQITLDLDQEKFLILKFES